MSKKSIKTKEFTDKQQYVITKILLPNTQVLPVPVRSAIFALRRGAELTPKQSELLQAEVQFYATWLDEVEQQRSFTTAQTA